MHRSLRLLSLAPLAAFAALAALTGCYNVDLAKGARIGCTSNDECPPDFACRKEIGGLCVSTKNPDNTPPTILHATIDPPVARVGTKVLVVLDVSEPLFVEPALTLALDEGSRALAPVHVDGAPDTEFTDVYVAAGDESEGDHDITALLVDAAGNPAPDVAVGHVTFDFTPPSLADVTIDPTLAKDGTDVVLTLRSNEALAASSAVTIVGGRAFTADPPGADPLVSTWHLTPSVSSGDVEGDATIAVDAADAAGNGSNRVLDSALHIDFTPPAIDGAAVIARPVVTLGQVALVSFHTTESVSDVSVELDPVGGGAPLTMTLDENSGHDVSFRREITAADPDGDYTVHLVTLVDLAGNAANASDLSGDVGVATVRVDTHAPNFVDAPVSAPAVASRATGHDLVTVTFTLDEDADVSVNIGADDAPCTSVGSAPAVSYTCERGIGPSDVDGTYGVTVTAIDGAGNTAFTNAVAVTYDFTAPTIALNVVPNRAARAGESISLTAIADEVIDPASVVFTSAGLAFPTPSVSGRSATTTFTVPAGLEGSFTTTFSAADLGGNAPVAPASTVILVDGVAPSLTSFSLDKPRVAPSENFSLTLRASEPLAHDPVVTFANGDVGAGGAPIVNPMVKTSGPSAQNDYTFRGTGPAQGQNQFYTITVLLEDAAGNQAADSPSVIIIDNAPPVLTGFDIAPAAAKSGDTVRVVVTADETLQGPPTIVAHNGAASFTMPPVSAAGGALSYVFTMPVDGSTAQGTWSFGGFTLTDEAGNSGPIAVDPSRTFVVDSLPPNISGVTASATRVKVGASFDVSFTTSEAVTTPNVVVGSAPMTLLSSSGGGTAFTFRYTATGSEPEGLEGVTISVSDPAGNVGVAGTDVEFDFSAPHVLSTNVTPSTAKAGETITYTVSADEGLIAPPVLTIGGASNIPFLFQSGTTFAYTYTVTGSEPQGARSVTIAMTDLAGNASVPTAGVGFSLDTNIPGITNLIVTPRVSHNGGHDVVTASFTLSEDVGAGLQVAVGGTPAVCVKSALDFTCTYHVQAGDTEGTKSVTVQASDAAGNTGFQSSSSEFDFTAPALVSVPSVTPATAKVGDTITYTLAANEAVASTPVLATSGPSPVSFTFSPSTQFTFQYTVTGAETSGARTTTVVMTDLVGNTSTPLVGAGFALDTTIPTITNLVVTPRVSRIATHNQVTATFTLSESVGAGLLVTVGGQSASCVNAGLNFTCTYTVQATDTQGTKSLSVTATDAAGNVGNQSASVEFDFTAPALVSVPSVTPANAKVGDTVTYTLAANEALGVTPVLNVSGASPTVFSFVGGTQFTFQYVVLASDTSGARTSTVTLTDVVGNTSTALSGASFAIDTTVPQITALAVTPRVSKVAGHTVVTATFTLSENVGAGLVVRVGSNAASCTNVGLNFTCTYTVQAADTQGTKSVSVTATDAAGNVGNQSASTEFDFTAPALVSLPSVTPANAKAGDTITYTLAANEALAGTPVLSVSGASPTAFSFVGGTQFTFQYVVLAGDTSGARTSTVTLTDLVGNTSAALAGAGFAIDTTVPTVSSLVVTPRVSKVAGHNVVTATFTLSESVGGAGLVVTVGNNAMSCTNAGLSFTCTYTVQAADTQGTKGVSVQATDAAGNVGVASGSSEFDFTAPGLVSLPTVTPTTAKVGDVITYTLAADEPLTGNPVLTTAGPSPISFSFVNGTQFTFQYTVTGAETAGARTTSVVMTDAVGNTSAPLAGAGFSLDTTVPQITALAVTPRVSKVAGHTVVTATFTLSENVGAGLVVHVGANAASCTNVGLNFTCTYTVQAADTQGTKSVTVSATDAAGNVGFQSASTEFDFTAPALVSLPSVTPANAKVGDTITYTLAANEALSATPVLSVSGASPTAFSFVGGTQFTFQYVVLAGDTSGARTSTVTLTDLVGNTSTALAGAGFSIDTTVPAVSSLVVTPRVSKIGGHNVVTATFTLSESASLVVTVGNNAMSCSAAGLNFTCTYTVQAADTEGTKGVSVQATDAAGNVGVASGQSEFDFTAPGLVSLPTVTPSTAKVGDVITYTVAADEPLSANPALATAGPSPISFSFVNGTQFTFQYTVTGAETAGARTTSVVMTDAVGNTSSPLVGTGFSLDTTVPQVTALVVTPRVSKVAGHTVVTATFTLSENVGAGLVVKVGANAASCSSVGLSFTCTYTVQAADTQGTKSVTVSATDAAGNVGNQSASTEFDFTAPALVSLPSVTPANAKVGDTITYTLAANEALAGTPVLNVSGASPTAFSFVGGTQFTFQYVVLAGDTSGARTSTVTLTDVVGNTSSALAGAGFSIDTTVPTVSSLVVTPRVSKVGGHNVVTGTFTLSENVGAGLVVTVGTNAMSCSNAGLNFTCTYTVQAADTQGTKGVSVQATDAAGNVGVASGSSEFDFTAPGLVSLPTVTPATAKVGDVITYTLAADEPLSANPVLATAGPSPVSFSFVNGTQFTFQYTVTGAETAGARTTSVVMTDAVGNTSSPLVGAGFSLDTTVPQITALAVTPRVSKVAGHTVVTATFTLSENVGAGLVVRVGGNAASCTNVGLNFTCTYTVQAADTQGTKSVTVSATDAAGNVGFQSASTEFDFTAPALVSLPSVTPANAKVGDTITYTLAANEALSATPVLSVSGASPTSFSFVGGTQFTFQYVVLAGDTSGARTSTVTLTDLVGNTSAALTGAGFAIDTTVPSVSSLVTTPRVSKVAGHNVVTATFTLSENVGAGLVVTVGGNGMSCTNVGLSFTCTYTVQAADTQGTKGVSVQATDAAGNVGVASGSSEFDFTAPALVSLPTVTPSTAKPGDVITYTIAANEALVSAPTVVTAGPSPVSFTFSAGTQFVFQYTVTGAETSGARTSTVTMTDVVGNTSAALTGAGFVIDTSPPSITSLALSRALISRQAGFNSTAITFTASDNIGAPNLQVKVGTNIVGCSNVGNNFTCNYSPLGTDVDGSVPVLVSATDGAGNLTSASSTLTFDFTAPTVIGTATVALTPVATNPNRAPTAVALGTTIGLGFTMSESLGAVPTVKTATNLTFTVATNTNPSFAFNHTLASAPSQGAQTVNVTAQDLVGNSSVSTLSLNAPGFLIDTVAPLVPAVSSLDKIVYARQPWGSSNGSKAFSIVGLAGAVENNAIAIAYNQANVSGAGELGRTNASGVGAFTLNLDALDRAHVFIAAVDAAGNSSDDTVSAGVQASRVRDVTWLANMNQKVPGSFVDNPHTFERRQVAEHTRIEPDSEEIGTAAMYQLGDGQTTTTSAQPKWTEVRSDAPTPLPSQTTLAYDVDRGVVWMPGGPTGMQQWDGVRWTDVIVKDPEGDGNPELTNTFAIVYDELRGETVLFGGADNGETWVWNGNSWAELLAADVNGDGFAPPQRGAFSMAWDDDLGGIIVFGGSDGTPVADPCSSSASSCLSDTWLWDGTSWNDFTSSAKPTGRDGATMIYNDDDGTIVLFGGENASFTSLADTWLFDGADWNLVTAPGVPARLSSAMVHDPVLHGVVMFGGETSSGGTPLGDEFFWNGATWAQKTPADPEKDGNPVARAHHAMVYDRGRDHYVLFGGQSNVTCSSTLGTTCDDTWHRAPGNTGPWTIEGPNNTPGTASIPQARKNAAFAFDRTRDRGWLFGGAFAGNFPTPGGGCNTSFCGDLFEWQNAFWIRQVALLGTPPTSRAGMAGAFDEANNVTVMFGGAGASGACDGVNQNGFCDGMYKVVPGPPQGQSTFSRFLPVTRPTARSDAAMTYDVSHARVVMFGGERFDFTRNAETWLWNGTANTWAQACTAAPCTTNAPAPRVAAAMAYDRTRNVAVLFGGDNTGAADQDIVFEWNGATWTRFTPNDPELDGSPQSRRTDATLVYDEIRHTFFYFGDATGGCSATPPTNPCSDAWELVPPNPPTTTTYSWINRENFGSPTNDGRPAPRSGHGSIYDAGRGETLVFGGLNGTFDTWREDDAHASSAAHMLHVDFNAAQADAGSIVRDVVVEWAAGATAFPTGTVQNGVSFFSITRGAPQIIGSNAASAASPATFTSSALTNINGLFSGDNELVFGAEPAAKNGTGLQMGTITSDYAEVRVRYRLP